MTRAACALGAAWLVACGPSPAFGPEPVEVVVPRATGEWTPAPDDLATPFAMGQTWAGVYSCAQGETNLHLHIVNVDGATVDALFDFDHPPSGAHGVFAMSGEYDSARRALDLAPGVWLDRPDGYVSVAMKGRLPLEGTRYLGAIDGPGCSTFRLRLVR